MHKLQGCAMARPHHPLTYFSKRKLKRLLTIYFNP